MAIRWNGHAGLKYLKNEHAAICIDHLAILENELQNIVNNPALITEYAQKSWDCGKRNHQIEIIQGKLYSNLQELLNKKQ